jgi:hypothetical protein
MNVHCKLIGKDVVLRTTDYKEYNGGLTYRECDNKDQCMKKGIFPTNECEENKKMNVKDI